MSTDSMSARDGPGRGGVRPPLRMEASPRSTLSRRITRLRARCTPATASAGTMRTPGRNSPTRTSMASGRSVQVPATMPSTVPTRPFGSSTRYPKQSPSASRSTASDMPRDSQSESIGLGAWMSMRIGFSPSHDCGDRGVSALPSLSLESVRGGIGQSPHQAPTATNHTTERRLQRPTHLAAGCQMRPSLHTGSCAGQRCCGKTIAFERGRSALRNPVSRDTDRGRERI